MSTKNKLKASALAPWKESLLNMVKEKNKLKQKIQPRQTKPILRDPDVKSYLDALHNRFIIIDKSANNFAFICKKYYISELLAEVGPSNSKSRT